MKNVLFIGYLTHAYNSISVHQHSFWEIVYYTHGNGILTVGETAIPFHPGLIVCTPPNIPHSEVAEHGFQNIHFVIENFEMPKAHIPIYTDNENKEIHHLLMLLLNEFHNKRHNWKPLTEGLLNLAFQYMLAFSSTTNKNPYVEKMEELLIHNLSNPNLNLKEMMKEIPISIDHARRLFFKENGQTPIDFLLEKKIEYAKILLTSYGMDGSMYIKEIAFMAGFSDPYYFSKVFKKLTGVSPRQYREK